SQPAPSDSRERSGSRKASSERRALLPAEIGDAEELVHDGPRAETVLQRHPEHGIGDAAGFVDDQRRLALLPDEDPDTKDLLHRKRKREPRSSHERHLHAFLRDGETDVVVTLSSGKDELQRVRHTISSFERAPIPPSLASPALRK